MWRSRCLTLLAAMLLLGVFMAATGWCGGPPVSREPAAAPFMGAPMAAADVGRPTGFMSDVALSTGAGSGDMPGTVGRSPRLRSEVYGVGKDGFAVNGRAQTQFRYKGLGAKIIADYLNTTWSGEGQYTSPFRLRDPNTNLIYYQQGDLLTSSYNSTVLSLIADLDIGTAGTVGQVLDVGPRFQFSNFSESLNVNNKTQLQDASAVANNSMIGAGIWANIDFIKLFGIQDRFFKGYQYGVTFYPKLVGAASLGSSRTGRFHSYELFVKIFKTSKDIFKNKYVKYAPALSGEIGYIGYNYKETVDDPQAAVLETTNGQYISTTLGNTDMNAGIFLARGYLTF